MTDFSSAHRKALVEDLLSHVQHRTADLLPFDLVREGLRLRHSLDRGIQEVPLELIVGSLGRTVLENLQHAGFGAQIFPINPKHKMLCGLPAYPSIEELQNDLDLWIRAFNEDRPHQGRWCFGKTPLQTFLDAIPIARENRCLT